MVRPAASLWFSPGLVLGLVALALAGDGLYRILRRAGILPDADPAGADPAADPAPVSAERERLRAELRLGEQESAGLRILLALSFVPWAGMLLDLARIPIRQGTLLAVAALVFSAGLAADGFLRRGRSVSFASRFPKMPRLRWSVVFAGPGRSPAAWLLSLGCASLIFMSWIHTTLVPERNYDALVGYDLVGKVMAAEGRLRSSIFSRIVFNAQAIYPPFTSVNDGFWYLFHPAAPRLWVPLLAAGFLLVFGARVRRWTGSPTAAALASFLVFLPTALLFQLTVAQTDLPSMVFIALAVMAVAEWPGGSRVATGGAAGTATRDPAAGAAPAGSARAGVVADDSARAGERIPAPPGVTPASSGPMPAGPVALYLFLAATARTENVVFGAALTVIALLRGKAGRWRGLWWTALPLAFFLFWNLLYVKTLFGYNPSAHFRNPGLDFGRMAEVLGRAVTIAAQPKWFGEFSWLVVLLAPLWMLGRRGERRGAWPSAPDYTGRILLFSAVMFVFYMPYFYFWDPVLNPLTTMDDTFKRGFFRFMPGVMAAFVACPPVLRFLRKCEAAPDPA